MIILTVLFFMLICNVIFEIPMYAIILGIVGLVAVVLVISAAELKKQKETAEKITHATLITETAVYVKKAKINGYSVSFRERRDHYSYTDVVDHYECAFRVTYNDGKTDILTCVKNSLLYNELILKDTH